jgi:hypothetical protein
MKKPSVTSGMLLTITFIAFLVMPAWAEEPPRPEHRGILRAGHS